MNDIEKEILENILLFYPYQLRYWQKAKFMQVIEMKSF